MASFGPKGGKKEAGDGELAKLQASIVSLSDEFSKISLACADASKAIRLLGESASSAMKNITKASADAAASVIKEVSKSKAKSKDAGKAAPAVVDIGESEDSLLAGIAEISSEIVREMNAYSAEISDKMAQRERQSGIEQLSRMLGDQPKIPYEDIFDEVAALKQAFFEAKRIQDEINQSTTAVAQEVSAAVEDVKQTFEKDPIAEFFDSMVESSKSFGEDFAVSFGEELQSIIEETSAGVSEWGKEIQSVIDQYKPTGKEEKAGGKQGEGKQGKGGIFSSLIRPINETALLFRNISRSMGLVFEATEAVNPALMFQLGMAFRDLYGVLGRAFQPIVQAFVVGIRTFADILVPVVAMLKPIFDKIASSALKLFVSLFPAFQALLPILGLFLQVFDFVIRAITLVAEPLIFVFGALAAILIYQSIPAIVTFVTSLLTTSAIMTAGLSLLIGALGWIVAKIFGFGSKMDFKPGASLGAGTRQSGYSSFEEYGRSLMQQSIGGSTQSAALQTAQYTRESRDYLAQIANKGNKPRQDGGMGVGVKPDKMGGDWGDAAARWVAGWFV